MQCKKTHKELIKNSVPIRKAHNSTSFFQLIPPLRIKTTKKATTKYDQRHSEYMQWIRVKRCRGVAIVQNFAFCANCLAAGDRSDVVL